MKRRAHHTPEYLRFALVALFTAALCLLVLPMAGCKTTARTAPRVIVAPMGEKTQAEIDALNAQIAELRKSFETQRDLAQLAAGAVYGAAEANLQNPMGLPREATAAQLEEAARALPAPTDAQRAEKAAQNARILAGELVAVKAEMGQRASEIDALKASLSASQAREAELERKVLEVAAAAEKERAEAAAKFQREIDAERARTAAAEDEARNKVAIEQARELNHWGAYLTGAGIAALGLAGIFGGIAALRAVGPIALLAILAGMACFGLAQIVSQAWFKWAVLGVVALMFAISAWWVVKKYQAGVLKESLERKTAKLGGALKQIVPALDTAYDEASADVREVLDRTVFSRLSSLMDKEQKNLIHELRASPPTP